MQQLRNVLLTGFLVLVLIVSGCGGGGGGSSSPVVAKSTVSGTAAVNGTTVDNATVQAYYYDDTGTLQEIVATNAPVVTAADGSYDFQFNIADLVGINGPIIVIFEPAVGSTEPTLKTMVADPVALQSSGGTSAGSSNALTTTTVEYLASYLENQPAGTTADATTVTNVVTTIKNAFDITSWDNATSAQEFETTVLPNLNNDATLINDFAEFLADDLTDGTLNGQAGSVALDPVNYGSLSTVLPSGIADFHTTEINTTDASIGSDGVDSTAITVEVLDAAGAPVANVSVDFTVSAGGTLDQATATTNAAGIATVNLTATTPGSVTVTATYTAPGGGTLTNTLPITVTDCQAIAGITLSTDKTTIYDDSSDSALITADVSAVCTGSTVADNTDVSFITTSGTGGFSTTIAQTFNGQATTYLTSGTVSNVTVQGTSGGFSSTVDVNVINHPCDPAGISLASDAASIVVGSGLATITATVTPADAANCPAGVFDGTPVTFAVTGSGSVSAAQQTTVAGTASVTFTPSTAGTDTVTATANGQSSSTNIVVVDQPTTTTIDVFVPANTSFAGLSVTLNYDQTSVTFNAATSTTLTTGWSGAPNDNSDTVAFGLFSFTEVVAGAGDSVARFVFDVSDGVPTAADFPVTAVNFADQNGADIGLTPADVTLQVTNN